MAAELAITVSGVYERAQQLQEQELQHPTLTHTSLQCHVPTAQLHHTTQTRHSLHVLTTQPESGAAARGDNSETMAVANTTEKYNCCTPGLPRWTYRNLYAVSISFMFTFSAFYGLQGLQSSLNEQLGVISLSVTYGFYFLFGVLSTTIVRLLSTKYALFLGFLSYTVYTLTNFYPRFYTLIPVAVLVGSGTAPIWAGISTHLGVTALQFAVSPSVTESFDSIITKFTGISFFALQMSQIIGNIVSSLVLFPYNSFSNGSSTFAQTSDICNNTQAQDVTSEQLYILLSIYLGFDIIGITILLIFVSRIPQNKLTSKLPENKCKRYCLEPFVDLMSVHVSWKMLLLGPLSLYNGATIAFSFSSYTRNVVSKCIGVGNIGFTLIVLGFFSAITSVIYGRLAKYFHRVPFALSAAFMNLFFFLFLIFYQPLRPSYALAFLFAIFWGIAGGIWNTLSSSLVGILFPTIQDSAYSAFRMWFSLGYAIGFAITEIEQLRHQCWLMIALLLVCFSCYILLEVFTSKWGQRMCCHKNLGVFDGPTTKYHQLSQNFISVNEDLTEDMLEPQNLNRKELPGKIEHTGDKVEYVPPTTRRKKREKMSLVRSLGNSIQGSVEFVTKDDVRDFENEIQLFHTTAF